MQPSALRAHVLEEALSFCWDSWAQMGISHLTSIRDDRAADPEALIVFTLDVARHDPRLFDELLDWLRTNERLISVQRLRNLASNDSDRQVVQAALAWVSRFRRNPRFTRAAEAADADSVPLFPGAEGATWDRDPAFLEHGLVRGTAEPSFKSRRPDVSQPINLAFRLRLVLGVGSRSEVIRYLLTMPTTEASVQAIAQATAFAKRNVAETLDGLLGAGVVRATTVTSERRYSLDRDAWSRLLLLEPDRLPGHRDWPQLLRALGGLLRFLSDPALDELSPYMRASTARDHVENVERELRIAGVGIPHGGAAGEEFWPEFVEIVNALLRALRASVTT